MTWLTWRLQRTELLLLGTIMVVLVGMLLGSYEDLVEQTTVYTAETCPRPLAGGPGMESYCDIPAGWLYELVWGWLRWFDFLPLVAALLLALPVVIELENGTYRLAWTQGVSRGQWSRVKLAILALSGLVFATVFTLTFHWWSTPLNRTNGTLGSPWYDLRGILPIGYTIFAIGLMLTAGTLLRRTVPTLLVTAVLYTAVRVPFNNWVRPYVIAPETKPTDEIWGSSSSGEGGPKYPSEMPWRLTQAYQTPDGKFVSDDDISKLCNSTGNVGKDTYFGCLEDNKLELMVTYHPASHYWPLQFAETGIYLAAGLLLIGFATWYMLRRIE